MAEFRWNEGAKLWIEANGAKLEATCFGPSPGQRPTIVMLHEGLGCIDLWRDLPGRLAHETGCGVFVWSRAGYGRSDPCDLPRPKDYMTIEALEALPQILDSVGIVDCILLGHSDGATIAAIYSGSVQDFRVRGQVLIAPHFFTEPMGLNAIAQAAAQYQSGGLKQRLAKYHSNVDCAFRGWNDAWLNPEFQDWNVTEVIDYWRVPTLAIQGLDDQYGSLAQIKEIEARSYAPVDVEILAECGHSPHLEQPEETVAAISQFVARLCRMENTVVAV